MTTTHRIAPGLYETAAGFRIERVNAEARAAGYGDAWHLFDANREYLDTFATKRDAVAAAEQLRQDA